MPTQRIGHSQLSSSPSTKVAAWSREREAQSGRRIVLPGRVAATSTFVRLPGVSGDRDLDARWSGCRCVGGGDHGDRYAGVGSAVGVVGDAGGSSVAVGDGFDDGETESGAVLAAGGVGASEAFEGVIKKGWWKAWAVVTDAQFEQTVVGSGAEADGGAAVTQRVVEEVG